MKDKIEYRDHTIAVDENYRFLVSYGDEEREEWFASLQAAKDDIDDKVKAKEKQARVKLNLKMIDDDGQRVTVTGIHSGHGKVLSTPAHSGHWLYPDIEWIAKLVAERNQLAKRQQEINRQIARYQVNTSRAYGRLSFESYGSVVERLTQEVDAKIAAAAKHEAANV